MNNKTMFTALLLGLSVSGLHAQNGQTEPTFTEWHDLQVNAVNRFATHTDFFAFAPTDDLQAKRWDKKQSKNYLSLDGEWKFNWVEKLINDLKTSSVRIMMTPNGRLSQYRVYGK